MTIEPIRLDVHVRASAAVLWRLLILDAERENWWGRGIVLEHHVGGRFEEPWTNNAGERIVTTGTVLRFEPQRCIHLSWKDPSWPAETEVEITLTETAAGTELGLVHQGWQNLTGLDKANLIEDHRCGWEYLLGKLVEVAQFEM